MYEFITTIELQWSFLAFKADMLLKNGDVHVRRSVLEHAIDNADFSMFDTIEAKKTAIIRFAEIGTEMLYIQKKYIKKFEIKKVKSKKNEF